METGYQNYKKASAMINDGTSMPTIFAFFEACLALPYDEGAFKNTADHVYGYFRKQVSLDEKNRFLDLMETIPLDPVAIKAHLRFLANRYEVAYILDSYYFDLKTDA